ncbi:hypothetical protein NXV73_02400 [Bacteroides salyersiae]|nr:hypothetical protein [Bacteroides salyersiae]
MEKNPKYPTPEEESIRFISRFYSEGKADTSAAWKKDYQSHPQTTFLQTPYPDIPHRYSSGYPYRNYCRDRLPPDENTRQTGS